MRRAGGAAERLLTPHNNPVRKACYLSHVLPDAGTLGQRVQAAHSPPLQGYGLGRHFTSSTALLAFQAQGSSLSSPLPGLVKLGPQGTSHAGMWAWNAREVGGVANTAPRAQ